MTFKFGENFSNKLLFKKEHAAQDSILSITEQIRQTRDNNGSFGAILLCLLKDFDLFSYGLQIEKFLWI